MKSGFSCSTNAVNKCTMYCRCAGECWLLPPHSLRFLWLGLYSLPAGILCSSGNVLCSSGVPWRGQLFSGVDEAGEGPPQTRLRSLSAPVPEETVGPLEIWLVRLLLYLSKLFPYSNHITCGVYGCGCAGDETLWPERIPLASVPWKIHVSLYGICHLSHTGQTTCSVIFYQSFGSEFNIYQPLCS